MIKVSQLSRSYGDAVAVAQVSFSIGAGEVVGLLGHNGAGKTTIMKMLTGYLEPSAGRIFIDQRDLAEERAAIQSLIGYLPENCPLYPEMRIIDYLDYHAAMHDIPQARRPQLIREALQRTWLTDRAEHRIDTLSRGYRQRVGVAQAILHQPRLLILDEPTNGLDPGQIQQMRQLIHTLAQQATLIISTHILQEVQATCDRVLILRSGRLVLDARLAELNQSSRLRILMDCPPEQALPLLGGDVVREVRHEGGQAGQHSYKLELEDAAPPDFTPQLIQRLCAQGIQLYAVHPERRDLETLFRELNSQPLEEVIHGSI